MTPRSKRYFRRKAWQSIYKLGQSIVQHYLDATKPIPKYPPGTHPGGLAMIGGEPGPERIFPRIELLPGTQVMPESLFKEGTFDVTITNAFTPDAQMTVKKVQL